MTALTRSQRVFNAVFPPEESPFLSGFVPPEQFVPDQQRLWDVVTCSLEPVPLQFSQREDFSEGQSPAFLILISSMEKRGETVLGRNESKHTKGTRDVVRRYVDLSFKAYSRRDKETTKRIVDKL